jgi:hypothetical protein
VRIEVDTQVLAGLAGALRHAASAVEGFAEPTVPEVGAVGAADALRMLLRVAREQRDDVAACLRGTAALVEAAVADYARTGARAVR